MYLRLKAHRAVMDGVVILQSLIDDLSALQASKFMILGIGNNSQDCLSHSCNVHL